jgi:hypothetical protein
LLSAAKTEGVDMSGCVVIECSKPHRRVQPIQAGDGNAASRPKTTSLSSVNVIKAITAHAARRGV